MQAKGGLEKLLLVSYDGCKPASHDRHVSAAAVRRVKHRSNMVSEHSNVGQVLSTISSVDFTSQGARILGTSKVGSGSKIIMVANTELTKMSPSLLPNIGIGSPT